MGSGDLECYPVLYDFVGRIASIILPILQIIQCSFFLLIVLVCIGSICSIHLVGKRGGAFTSNEAR